MSVALGLKDFLSKSDYKALSIPQYQRDYSWDQKQFEELWDDLENIIIESSGESELKVKNSHFIGLLVLITGSNGSVDIVDGQQRLTTIFILLNSIRDHFLDLRKGQEGGLLNKIDIKILQINTLLYQDIAADKLKKKLLPNNNDKKYFDEAMYYLNGENTNSEDERTKKYQISDNEQLDTFSCKMKYIKDNNDGRILRWKSSIKCYQFYYNAIKVALEGCKNIEEKMKYLEGLKLKIEKGLKLMIFDSKNESDAFNLFETLNDRGLSLASIDLIKNKILKSVPEGERDEASRKWDDIFGSKGILFGENINAFLRYYYISEKEYITKTELYNKWKDWVDDRKQDQISPFIDRLGLVAKNFCAIKNIEGVDDKNLSLLLLLLKKTNSTQWFSIGFPLKEIWDRNPKGPEERKLVYNIFWLLANVTVRFMINETRFNNLEKKFPVIAKCLSLRNNVSFTDDFESITESKGKFSSDIESLKHAEKLLNSIIDKFSPDSDLNLNDKVFDNNALATILLRMAYNSSLPHGHIISQDLTLEHVLPVKHQQKWMSHDKFADAVKFKLGNMLLLERELNSSVSNGSFEDKKAEYDKNSVYDLDGETGLSYKQIESQNGWNEDFINKRTVFIINKLMPLLLSRQNPY
ncbi:DUF262 domain-containing protein [Candidatus Gracilibacteria bacterium]|nr:DUF262 domain-containing protein [Candidatus Gracilibacteria bacterium]